MCAKGKYLAFVSTAVETANPTAELMPGLQLLGSIDEYFVQVSDVMEPVNDGSEDGCYISKGYDATTHFQSTVEDVLEMYKKITGKDVNLDADDPAATAGQEQ